MRKISQVPTNHNLDQDVLLRRQKILVLPKKVRDKIEDDLRTNVELLNWLGVGTRLIIATITNILSQNYIVHLHYISVLQNIQLTISNGQLAMEYFSSKQQPK